MNFKAIILSFLLLILCAECRYRIPLFTTTSTIMRTPSLSNPTFYRPHINTFPPNYGSYPRMSGQTQYYPNIIIQNNGPIEYNPYMHGSSWADRIRIERMNEDSQNNRGRGRSLY